ncbi:hypothetical protein WMF41_43825 [Sorangium sp. So ce1151]
MHSQQLTGEPSSNGTVERDFPVGGVLERWSPASGADRGPTCSM